MNHFFYYIPDIGLFSHHVLYCSQIDSKKGQINICLVHYSCFTLYNAFNRTVTFLLRVKMCLPQTLRKLDTHENS